MTPQDRSAEILHARARSRRLALALVALCAVLLVGHAIREARGSEPQPALAPDFALKSNGGQNLRLSEYRSEVVALAFVASWCGGCRESLAELRQLQETLGPQGLQVMAVSFDEPSMATGIAAGAFPVLLDPEGEAGRLYDVGRLPTLMLVDRGGALRAAYRDGKPVAAAELERQLRALLAE